MLTNAGKTLLALGIALLLAGWIFGYRPLVGLALAALLLIAFAFLIVARKPTIDVDRMVDPERVSAGQPAESQLTITNVGRRSTQPGVAMERFGADAIPVTVPSLAAGESAAIEHELPTDRRGVFTVGPLVLNQSDPFSLVRRGEWKSSTAVLKVHPLVHNIDPFPSGATRDLDGPSSGEAPEGGVAFQNLREYVVGDDLRLIHWKSSAKIGELMVRHNVDTHQPRSLILFDTRREVYTDESFEDAVRVVASIAVASLKRRFPFQLRTTAGLHLDQSIPATQMLDELAAIGTSPEGSLATLAAESAREQKGFSLAVITGTSPSADLVGIGPLRAQFDRITIGRLGIESMADSVLLPGALLINARSSDEFTRAWNRRLRR